MGISAINNYRAIFKVVFDLDAINNVCPINPYQFGACVTVHVICFNVTCTVIMLVSICEINLRCLVGHVCAERLLLCICLPKGVNGIQRCSTWSK